MIEKKKTFIEIDVDVFDVGSDILLGSIVDSEGPWIDDPFGD